MADSEEFRLKRLKHEQHLSRVFDEVMGLGDFAESSRGSASSSKSGGQEDTKGADETSGQEELQQPEGDSDSSRPEEKMDEGVAESPLPAAAAASPSSERRPSFTMETTEGGGSGGAAFDDALDGLPAFGAEDEEEDWHFALPMGSLEDVDVDKANRANKEVGRGAGKTPGEPQEPREEEEEEEEEEEMPEKEGSSASANTSHSSREHTPENSRDVGSLNQAEETEDSQEGEVERSEAAPIEDSNPPMSPVNIKDEPIDEGYDAALLPQGSAKSIKEELDQEEELRISSVFSVGGMSTFVPPTVPVPVSTSTPTPTAIFIPGRGTVLQAVTPLPVRPPAPVVGALTSALTAVGPRPPVPQIPGSVRCSGCAKVLLKGQTAFQRKGSTQLFCSTVCLTGHLPPAAKNRTCFQCNKDILQPRDMITIPADDNNYIYVCSQFCLSVLRHKKKDKIKGLERKPEKIQEKPPEREKPSCSVCKISNRIEHEVSHQGRLHRLCSDACFLSWRKMRQLAMNCCEGCGLYCNSKSGSCQTLTIERSQLNFCGPTCISTYKQSCRKTAECAFCHKIVVVSSTIMERDPKGKIQLYCSSTCVDQSRPARHVLSGTAFPCCLCKVSAVPQYHLAMVDGTIRNFCSYECVSTFRKSGQPSQMEILNGASRAGLSVPPIPQDYPSSVPYPGHHPSNSSVPPLVPPYSPSSVLQARTPTKAGVEGTSDRLTCYQCSKQFSIKPQLISHQGRISVFCSKACCDEYKTQKDIIAVCDHCKKDKVIYETINYNQQDLFFCSDNCKMLFKHELTARNNDHTWRPCSYCSSYSPKMLHSHYGGRMEEFCRPHCMSQYTVLYYGMGRCDNCRRQGYLTDKLQCMGSVRNFCNLPCLLEYCYLHFEPIQHIGTNGTGTAPQTPHAPTQPHLSSKMNPVIADVVSLANGSATQPSVSADTGQTGALPASTADSKNLDHASTQTDALRIPRRCQMKNKSVLCRPFTMDQESMCALPAASTEPAAVSIIAPALQDSASQAAPPTANASTSPAPSPEPQAQMKPCNGLPARLTGRHFLGKRDADSDCKVCSQHKRRKAEDREDGRERKRLKLEKTSEETDAKGEKSPDESKEEDLAESKDCEGVTARSQTSYYCKSCSGEPSLCPVPCFELYHTKLIYKNTPDLETQGEPTDERASD